MSDCYCPLPPLLSINEYCIRFTSMLYIPQSRAQLTVEYSRVAVTGRNEKAQCSFRRLHSTHRLNKPVSCTDCMEENMNAKVIYHEASSVMKRFYPAKGFRVFVQLIISFSIIAHMCSTSYFCLFYMPSKNKTFVFTHLNLS